MLKERRELVEMMTQRVHQVELVVEQAMIEIASLASALPAARMTINASPVAGQDAFDSLGAAFAGICTVRGHMVATHMHLATVRDQYRLPITGTGGGQEKPSKAIDAPAHPVLAAVA